MEFANEISVSFDKSLLPQAILAASTSHFHEIQNFGRIKQTNSALGLRTGEAKIDPSRQSTPSFDNRLAVGPPIPLVGPAAMD
jgi:hypothetical protein